MRRTLKTLLTGAITIVALALALALTAGSASAQIVVIDETIGFCSTVTLGDDGHTVSGGCHVEYESEEHIPLVAYVPNPIVVMACNWHIEARIGENGEGYVTSAVFTNEDPTPNPPCTRAPCDEDSGAGSEMIPWPVHIDEDAPGAEELEFTFCWRTISSGEGGAGSQCELHLPLSQVGHAQELGDHAAYFCETTPVPTSFQDIHFVNETGSTEGTIEVIH